jgi:phosphate-selective porin OprO/OprP
MAGLTAVAQDAYDKLWSNVTLYESEENSFLQKLVTTGRLQYDYSYFDEDEVGHQDDTKWRRARAGFKATLFNKFTLHSEMDMDFEKRSPVYKRLTDTNISWKANDNWTIKVGKQSAGFTLDGATSSKKLIGIERGKVSGNLWFTAEYFPGITVSGTNGNWLHNYGIFSNDGGQEFSEVGEEKYFLLLSTGYDFGSELEVDHAILRVDFVHNKESDNVGTKKLENVISFVGKYDNESFHFHGDITIAESFSGSDVYGFVLMPFYDLSEMFQLVGRYSYLSSSDNNALGLSRYEKDLVSGKGNALSELFIGLNTYFYGHKLKWQNGIQFTSMDDDANDGGEYDGIGFTSALRLSW